MSLRSNIKDVQLRVSESQKMLDWLLLASNKERLKRQKLGSNAKKSKKQRSQPQMKKRMGMS